MLILQKNGALNGALKAFGLIDVPLSFLNSTTGVLIGMIHILLPYMLLPLISNLRQMDRNLINASSVLGAGPVQSFVFVYLPLSVPAIVAGCTLVFVTALGFFITPSLLGGAKNTMIAVLISQQVTVLGDWGMASTLATILLATTLVIYGAFSALMRNPTGSQ
ncbi:MULTISPECIES: ABC transporter permease [unclassified Mesorhizobium]|uniref:ABC transporter permease n=1 Tax=unclassified Mesorhizobium TaxID=325217 RepID=UPI001FDF33D3|nr:MULTISPECIES: ABC transporter permease [unclassified Mesorhizobium]